MDSKIFSERFCNLISHTGMSRNKVARAIGVSESTVSRWANGRVPDLEYLIMISEYFEVTMEWLLGIDIDTKQAAIQQGVDNILKLYALASPEDKLVIQTILRKYETS